MYVCVCWCPYAWFTPEKHNPPIMCDPQLYQRYYFLSFTKVDFVYRVWGNIVCVAEDDLPTNTRCINGYFICVICNKRSKKNPAIFCQAYHSHGKKNSIYCVIRALIMVRRVLRVKTLYLETNETNEQTQRLWSVFFKVVFYVFAESLQPHTFAKWISLLFCTFSGQEGRKWSDW